MGKTGFSARRAERVRAFQILYGLYFSDVKTGEDLERLFDGTPLPEGENGERGGTDRGFAWELVAGVFSRQAELDALIARFSRNWRLERMGRVELTLLRLAVFELFFRPDVPPRAAINEALDLAARFGDDTSKKFINGILDAAARDAEKRNAFAVDAAGDQ